MGFLKKLFQIVSGKKYRNCPDGAAVDPVAQRALQAGLINSEQIMAYCDSYTTGLSHSTLAEGLGSHWDISSPQEAAETLESLGRYGHRFFYDIVFRVHSDGASEGRQEVLEALIVSGRYGAPETVRKQITAQEPCEEKSLVFSALEQAMEMLGNLRSVFRLVEDKVNGSYLPKDYSAGILAWDLGRLVTVARMSLDCKYIELDEFSRILAHVDKEVRSNFSSWPQFAKSYIIGRASWAGQNMMLSGITGIAEDLMTDDKSPWVLSPL
ncbi:hypothetical protein ASC78_15490 [Variovorax sp. Root318D1]|uniref:DUF1266 domain-containing protein n=1 Tax=Variovorax sp. Root318D1 TaxID=1736513 RepID=UPI0006FC9D8C|nr:DUF1266 domain-containing protein [Variovorax sp. Root318D1]KQU82800.1 hypothetical protein ASC78_15490 [Variovorax sp. Root318D1]